MKEREKVWLRLTGRPELERGYWFMPEARPVTILRRTDEKYETVVIKDTGHRENGVPVWTPEDRIQDWPKA